MSYKDLLPYWLTLERIKPAVAAGFVLALATYGIDMLLQKFGTSGSATLLNELAIGILGALLVLFYLTSVSIEENYRRAQERIMLVAELNHHVRGPLALIQTSVDLENRVERIRLTVSAIEQIDRALTDLVPTIGSATGPRFFLPESK